MVLIPVKVKQWEFKIHEEHKKVLDDCKYKGIPKNWDFVFIYDGLEGAGKTTKATQDGLYVDETLSLDDYSFSGKQIEEWAKNAPQHEGKVGIYDEAVTGLEIKDTMAKISKNLKKVFTQIRYKNLFVFVIMPSYFDFQRWWAVHRSDGLVHCYADGFNRGFFKYYDRTNKKYLYINGRKFYDYNVQRANFNGSFTDFFPFDWKKYNKKKADAVMEGDKEVDNLIEKIRKKDLGFFSLLKFCRYYRLFNTYQLSRLTNINRKDISEYSQYIRGGDCNNDITNLNYIYGNKIPSWLNGKKNYNLLNRGKQK